VVEAQHDQVAHQVGAAGRGRPGETAASAVPEQQDAASGVADVVGELLFEPVDQLAGAADVETDVGLARIESAWLEPPAGQGEAGGAGAEAGDEQDAQFVPPLFAAGASYTGWRSRRGRSRSDV
jgi:hypothetical protein